MGQCLITKLKESVNNDELLKIGELRLKSVDYVANETNSTVLYASKGFDIEVVKGGQFVVNNRTTQEVGNVSLPINTTQAGSIISLPNKYELLSISVGSQHYIVNLDDLKYCKKLTNLAISNCVRNGNLESIADITTLTDIRFNGLSYLDESTMRGDIKVLGKMVNATRMWFHQEKLLEGNVEELIESLYKNNKRTGTVELNYNTSNIRFNGSAGIGTSPTLKCVFSADGCEVKNNSTSETLATYTANNNKWAYL